MKWALLWAVENSCHHNMMCMTLCNAISVTCKADPVCQIDRREEILPIKLLTTANSVYNTFLTYSIVAGCSCHPWQCVPPQPVPWLFSIQGHWVCASVFWMSHQVLTFVLISPHPRPLYWMRDLQKRDLPCLRLLPRCEYQHVSANGRIMANRVYSITVDVLNVNKWILGHRLI